MTNTNPDPVAGMPVDVEAWIRANPDKAELFAQTMGAGTPAAPDAGTTDTSAASPAAPPAAPSSAPGSPALDVTAGGMPGSIPAPGEPPAPTAPPPTPGTAPFSGGINAMLPPPAPAPAPDVAPVPEPSTSSAPSFAIGDFVRHDFEDMYDDNAKRTVYGLVVGIHDGPDDGGQVDVLWVANGQEIGTLLPEHVSHVE